MIQLGFSTTDHLLSKIIRKVTNAKTSHCWLLYTDPVLGGDFVMQAELNGIVLTPWDQFVKKNVVVAVIEPVVDMKPGLLVLAEYLGSMYDFGGLLGGFFVIVSRWLHRKIHNPFDNPHALFCSEAVTVALQAAKYPGTEDLVPKDTSPEDLLELLQR